MVSLSWSYFWNVIWWKTLLGLEGPLLTQIDFVLWIYFCYLLVWGASVCTRSQTPFRQVNWPASLKNVKVVNPDGLLRSFSRVKLWWTKKLKCQMLNRNITFGSTCFWKRRTVGFQLLYCCCCPRQLRIKQPLYEDFVGTVCVWPTRLSPSDISSSALLFRLSPGPQWFSQSTPSSSLSFLLFSSGVWQQLEWQPFMQTSL